jgi:aminodeoxyfutalosine deaminase
MVASDDGFHFNVGHEVYYGKLAGEDMRAKAELHLHLEGSVERETLREIDPALDESEIEAAFAYADFLGFLKAYVWVCRQMTEPGHYAIAARRLLERLAAQNVKYAEITLSAGVVHWKGQEFPPIYEAVQREAARSAVRVRWIVDAVRQWPVEEAMRVARLAVERAGDGVAAFGIGGDEARGPAALFADVFQYARDGGLHTVAHAGETTGPESVWAALKIGAERIGHGIRAIDDPALVEHLAAKRIPLEICITSNLRTRAVASLAEHPVRRLYEAGVPIVLNTDDPALFETTIEREFAIARKWFGFSDEELGRVAQDGFQFAFDAA